HKSRQQIYATLANHPANYPQRFPFRFSPEGFDIRFKDSGLPIEHVERIRRLTYTNSGYLCFTDLDAMKQVLSPDEFNDLVGTLYVVPAYFLRLHVQPDSDVDS